MSALITAEEAGKLLDEVAQNQPRVCLAWCLKSAEDCLCYKAKIAEGALYSAAPDLARTVIALHADRERFSQGIRRLTAENERLREALIEERTETLWSAYNTGAEQDGRWRHMCMSDGEWLARECGLDASQADYPADVVKGEIPLAAERFVAALKGQQQ